MAASWEVALVGDSVLDDHYWLKDPRNDVRAQLERTLTAAASADGRGAAAPAVKTWNFAVDESTVGCVLHGRRPGLQYRVGRRRAGMEPYPVEPDGVQRPLKLLRDARPTHVVLSIGGNDARVRFLQSRDPQVICELMVSDCIVSNLRLLIETIRRDVTPNIVLVYVYMPEFKTFPLLYFLPPASVLKSLLVHFSKFYIEAANEYRLPLVDLSRTFDPYNSSHYGTTPIEPSNESGQFIADLVLRCLQDFRFGEEAETKVYSGAGDAVKVQAAGPGSGFDYEKELEDFLEDRRHAKAKAKGWCLIS